MSVLSGLCAFGVLSGSLAWFNLRAKINDRNLLLGSSIGAYFGGGDGSAETPYIINTSTHLYNLAWLQYLGFFNEDKTHLENGEPVSGGDGEIDKQYYFILQNDIEMNGMYIPPIGTETHPFLGNFNGNNHVISDFTSSNILGLGENLYYAATDINIKEDIFNPLKDNLSEFIKPGHVVMELGFGQGANLLYLAHCHPDARFIGVDLSPLKVKDIPENVSTYQLDYSDLSRFDDNSIDVMYAFETVVHNTDKEKIYREVYRVLKPNGVIVVFDYALSAKLETYDAHIQKAIALISKGGAAAMIESLDELNAHYANCGLKLERSINHTRATLPDLKRLERKAAKILERPTLAKLMFWLLPDQFVTNIILGYLGYDSGNAKIGSYQEWVLRKP